MDYIMNSKKIAIGKMNFTKRAVKFLIEEQGFSKV